MPRRSRIRTAPLEDLARQQRFTPQRAILKQIARAEALASEVDPSQSYPEEWVVFRITGYRPAAPAASGDSDYEAAIIPGSALVGDLSAFVERLSDDAALSGAQMGDGFVGADELCERWKVSRKTLERYRRRGLVARRTRDALGHVRLVYARNVIEAFEARERVRLDRAGEFGRIPETIRRRIIRGAGLYAHRLGWTLNQAAGPLAQRYRVGHETVRQILLRHDESAEAPLFVRRPPLSVRERRVALRAYERGIAPSVIARRFGRSTASVHRVIGLRRTERLRRVPRPVERGEAFGLVGVGEAVLAAAAARQGLGAPFPTEVASLVALARAMPPIDAAIEHARAAAMQFLWWRATSLVAESHGGVPRSVELDRAETDLRWAMRLKAELVRAELPVIVRAVEERSGRELEAMDSVEACSLLKPALEAAASAIDRHDPFRGGRIAAPVLLAVSRALAHVREARTQGAGVLVDWSLRLTAWQGRFEPDPRLRVRLPIMPLDWRGPLALRFGWGPEVVGSGMYPHTRAEVEQAAGLSPQAQCALLRRALVFVRAAHGAGPVA